MKQRIGATAVIVGMIGAGFGVGGVENSLTTLQMLQSIGVAVTSLMLMYAGTLVINDRI